MKYIDIIASAALPDFGAMVAVNVPPGESFYCESIPFSMLLEDF